MARSTPPDQSASVNPVVEANRRVDSLLVSKYNETEPNHRPKGQAKVCRRLETLAALVPNRAFWYSVYSASEAAGRPIVTIVERGTDELVIHEQELQVQFDTMEAAALVDDHLHTLLPVSAHRFKYLILTGRKR